MSQPLGFFLTWTTYGTWLPGDERGWSQRADPKRHGPDSARESQARQRLVAAPTLLDAEQRRRVEQAIRDHCSKRGWPLHAVNVRSNHVHVAVAADDKPELIMNQLKVWASRRLNESSVRAGPWWTRHGSTRWLNDEASFWRAVEYVTNYQ